ncbi:MULTISPECIES: CHAT domain-containing protein [unclassified Coleofasciculus]|uniref:CHAT domain-containing protein n=1 Tax=unclassified Coleofasciculus TaxID=2692782 RepID=UPI0018811DB0|nr:MULTISPECIES: CHAT domain-containing protein [unclassified Coleofasciculus]MBE9126385.1 CHAT domain-containing protein [Coleofasciculus sp. LEGE 07081]MBE9149836.1 CHAT domain-containing protein [Coleofasciculus sp. LEGE 07092]
MYVNHKVLSCAIATYFLSLSTLQSSIATPLTAATLNSQSQRSQELETEVDRLFQEGIEQLHIGQLSEAAKRFEQALTIYRQELGNSERQLNVLIALSETYNSLGNYEQAIELAKESRTLADKLQKYPEKAAAYLTLASAYQSLGCSQSEYQKAILAARSGLMTAWKIQNPDSEAKAFALLGSVYNSSGQTQDAILFSQRGLNVAQDNKNTTAALSSLLTLGGVHLGSGDYGKVINNTEQALDFLRKHQLTEAEGTGFYPSILGAYNCVSQQKLNRQQWQEGEGAALVMQALAYVGMGNSNKAIELAEQGLLISHNIQNPLLEASFLIVLSLGNSYSGNPEKAIEFVNQSRAIAHEQNNRELEGVALEVLGKIYRNYKQPDKAISAYQEALSIHERYSAYAGIGGIYQDLNLLGSATTYYKQAINKNEEQVHSQIRGLPVWLQTSFVEAVQDIHGVPATEVYRSLTSLLLLQNRMREAQQVLELLKGQELREYTGDSRVYGEPIRLEITPTEQRILQEYGSLIAFGDELEGCRRTGCSQLDELLDRRDDLIQQYYQALEQIETLIRNNRSNDDTFLDPNQFSEKAREILSAQPNTLLIYPLLLNDRIWLLWASKGGILKAVEVSEVTPPQLEVTVLRFRQLLQNRLSSVDELQQTGKQLYDWLIKPLEPELKANTIQNLVFSLDRSTRYIPMSALFDGEQYLVENYTVSTVLSANLTEMPWVGSSNASQSRPVNYRATKSLSKPISLSPSNPEISVLGLGVSQAVGGFRSLPNVPAELDAIVRQESVDTQGIYPGKKFLNEDFDLFALRDNVSSHKMLHIATHGEFVPGPINRSYLLLGTGEKLAIPDIETWLDLQNVNLVVLSACEAALGGPGLNGREIAGVGYYFLKGGVQTVMASLWKVNDQSTRLLMEQFYQNLAQDTPEAPLTKAEALRQAQLAFLRGKDAETGESSAERSHPYSHPFYWSSFILMGSGL